MTEKEIATLLSPRELDVASYVAKGLVNKDVGCFLGIKDDSVKGHLTNVYRKIKIKNRYELRRMLRD